MQWILIFILATATLFGAIDINNASVKELTRLNGVGTKKAEAIVTFRKGQCFKTIDDLSKVNGIGKKTVEKNKINLKVGKCKR